MDSNNGQKTDFDLAIFVMSFEAPASGHVLEEDEQLAPWQIFTTYFVLKPILWSSSLKIEPVKKFSLVFPSLFPPWMELGEADLPTKAGWSPSQSKCKQGFRGRCTWDCIYLTKARGEGDRGSRMPNLKVVNRKESFTIGNNSDNEVWSSSMGAFPKKSVNTPIVATVAGWESQPGDVLENIFLRLEFKDLLRCKTLSWTSRKRIESDDFIRRRGAIACREGSFTAINYYIMKKEWQCTGFDLNSRRWRRIPTFSCLPAPDAALFKEYSVSGHGGLMCAEVSKWPQRGELVVFNPLTGKKRPLPPLLHPRNPVLIHIAVNSSTNSYKVIVAGSSNANDEQLSRKKEIFDSLTSQWEEKADLPGPAFALNEHQTGVCVHGTLHFIAFLENNCQENDCRRGILAFNVDQGTWLLSKTCPIPFSATSNSLQLVETDGKVYLFSEQERNGAVEHRIDELEVSDQGSRLRNVLRVQKTGGRGLQVYPEYVCVGFGEGRLCIFNALNRDGVVYDVEDGTQCEVLQAPPPDQAGDGFFSLNPTTFTLQPSFLCNQLI